MGAAGRDFHNFNLVFRQPDPAPSQPTPGSRVVAFTATQIPGIENRRYPSSLAGPGYPEGIPIYPEAELEHWIRELAVDEVVFAYSDVSFPQVMEAASRVLACGADFRLLGPHATTLRSRLPVVAICAVRTGAGKSQTARRVVEILRQLGVSRIAVLRHPMPYGELEAQHVQRFAGMQDLDRHGCTLEEREEYEPHLRQGNVVYAGVDYQAIVQEAEKEADLLVWDGGNNDLPFLHSDMLITVVDPLRLGDEQSYYPGQVNLRRAQVVMINKVDSATWRALSELRQHIHSLNPGARVIEAESVLRVNPERIRGKRVVVVDDGPSLTHGDMAFGAGYVAANRYGADEIIDPRPFAVGTLAQLYQRFPHLGKVIPAMGYSPQQRQELRQTLESCGADVVVAGTPIDLGVDLGLTLPVVNVEYDLAERGPCLRDALRDWLENSRARFRLPESDECGPLREP